MNRRRYIRCETHVHHIVHNHVGLTWVSRWNIHTWQRQSNEKASTVVVLVCTYGCVRVCVRLTRIATPSSRLECTHISTNSSFFLVVRCERASSMLIREVPIVITSVMVYVRMVFRKHTHTCMMHIVSKWARKEFIQHVTNSQSHSVHARAHIVQHKRVAAVVPLLRISLSLYIAFSFAHACFFFS